MEIIMRCRARSDLESFAEAEEASAFKLFALFPLDAAHHTPFRGIAKEKGPFGPFSFS
jgi:hypothetical protein